MMWDSEGSRLSTWVEETYEVLAPHISEREGGLSHQDAETFLTNHGELDLSESDARYALEQLVNRGYLYEVQGDLFVTQSETT